ncbi:MAG: helix-hairpin-helix domain-containing protein [Endomicrobia bacterium]|nr:helix-hairpin-helix domain-containing protein [Endomicrobiia bacterium]
MFRKTLLWYIGNSLILKFILFSFLQPIFEERNILADASGVLNCGLCLESQSAFYLVPSIPSENFLSCGFSKTELYSISKLKNNNLAIRKYLKTLNSEIGFMFNNFGFNLYNENFYIINFAFRQKEDLIHFGFNCKLLETEIINYGKNFYSSMDISLFTKIEMYNFCCAITLKNAAVLYSKEKIFRELIISNRINFSKNLVFLFDVIKNLNGTYTLKTGNIIKFHTQKNFILEIQVGTEFPSNNKSLSYSAGLAVKKLLYQNTFLNLNYSLVINNILGQQYLFLAGLNLPKNIYEYKKKDSKKFMIDINTATKEDLMDLPGIGEKIAEAIIEYRRKYGNFNSIYELLYIPGISSKKLENIKKYVDVNVDNRNTLTTLEDGISLIKLNLNLASKEQLVELGFTKREAFKIIKWRKKRSKFTSVEQLFNVPGIDYNKVLKVINFLYVE